MKSAATDFVFAFESILQFASNSTDGVMGIPKQLTREFPQHLQSMLEQGGAWKRFLQQIRVFKLRRSVIALHASLEAFQGYRDPSTKHQLVEMITAARTFLGGLEGGRELARLDEELQLAPPPQHSQVFFALNGQALIWHHRHTVNHEDTAMQLVIDPAFAYKTSQWTDVPMQNRSMDERTPLFWKLVKEEVENQEYHNLFAVAEDARTFLVGLSEGQGLLTSAQMLALPVPVPRQRMLDIIRAFHPHFRRVMPADQRDEDEELWMEAVDNFHATASHADALIHLFRSIYRSHATALVVGTNRLFRSLAMVNAENNILYVQTKFTGRFPTTPRTEAWLRAAPPSPTPKETVAGAFLTLIDVPMEELPETFSALECQHINALVFEKHFLVKGVALLDACQAFPEARIRLLEFVETQPVTATFPYDLIPLLAIQAVNNQDALDTVNRSLLRALLGQEEQEFIPSNRYLAHRARTLKIFNAYYAVFGDLYARILAA